MPTTQPRYTVTDTGEVRAMLDEAHRHWPEVHDRKQLLLRLARAGRAALAQAAERGEEQARREDQRRALARASELVDVDAALGDGAWR